MTEAKDPEPGFSTVATSEKSTSSQQAPDNYEVSEGHLDGWRFWGAMIGLYCGLFLVLLELTIVATALVAITDDLKDFRHATWIANAYFLVWSGFVVLWSQFSHTTGRKSSFLTAFGLFVIFSAACAAAQTAIQLYVFRGLQGFAGAGVFSLPMVIISEAVPPSKMPKYSSLYALVALIALAAGPLIGGAIADMTTWRWVFILNIPAGVLAFLLILVAIPNSFPHQHKPEDERPRFKLSNLKQLDLVGGLLFLGLSILSVAALQEADSSYVWGSATIICLLVFAGLSAIAFAFWERYITASKPHIMPVMTYHFVQRKTLAMFASSFLIGLPYIFVSIQIPQRLQVIDGFSPLKAAVNLLPFSVFVTVGGGLSSVLGRKLQAQPIYGQMIGAVLQLIAVICFATDPLPPYPQSSVPARQYGFQILMGLGAGIGYNTNFTGMYYSVGGRKDLIASAVGANIQFRYFGCAIGIAAATAAFNTYVRSHLLTFLSLDEVLTLLQSTRIDPALSPEDQMRVLSVFSSAFVLQWKVMCGLVGASFLSIVLTY